MYKTNDEWEAWRDGLVKKYGPDRNVMGLCLVAILEYNNIKPELADQIRGVVDEWKDSDEYNYYCTKTLKERLIEIEDSPEMRALLHEIAVHVYHMEEGSNI